MQHLNETNKQHAWSLLKGAQWSSVSLRHSRFRTRPVHLNPGAALRCQWGRERRLRLHKQTVPRRMRASFCADHEHQFPCLKELAKSSPAPMFACRSPHCSAFPTGSCVLDESSSCYSRPTLPLGSSLWSGGSHVIVVSSRCGLRLAAFPLVAFPWWSVLSSLSPRSHPFVPVLGTLPHLQ